MTRTKLLRVAFGAVSLLTACSGGECGDQPARPAAQVLNGAVTVFPNATEEGGSSVNAESASVQLSGSRVTITYRQAGVTHTVVYDVIPAP